MDNKIPNHVNDPDIDYDEDNQPPSAKDIVDNILNNQVSDYDINDFMSVEDQAEAFREMVGIWASREGGVNANVSYMNRNLARIDMTDYMESALLNAVKEKGYQ